MFVRIKRVNGHDYVYLVENVREGGRHVQRVIKTLGRRDRVEAAGLLGQLAVSAVITHPPCAGVGWLIRSWHAAGRA